ncbi:MAG: class I SAM-dependent methyltransferase [Cyanobacteria bacterium J06627_28]
MQQLQTNKAKKSQQRTDCPICHYQVEPSNSSAFHTFRCGIRSLMDETFEMWRCPDCQTIHCLDVVDLDAYYAAYPFEDAQLVWPLRVMYSNLLKQLTRFGFSKHHSFLDYGCGVHGLLVQYLKEKGFGSVHGYDPYAPEDGTGDRTAVHQQQFDYISSQDVIEHVEDPAAFLSDIDRLTAPGGYILIGTPNASSIKLDRPDIPDYEYLVHAPYHLHIYTREGVESLGRAQGWQVVGFFDRKYDDTLWPCLNNKAVNAYLTAFDGSFDVLAEPINLLAALKSPRFILWSLFGYWFSLRAGMGVMFRKPEG